MRPVRSTFGKMFEGSLHSSAMFTESSKPTMAKKASVVAAMTDQNRPLSPGGSKVKARDTSPWPDPIAHMPMTMMIRRPVSSTQVSTTLAFTLSPTPRKLTMATTAMKRSPVSVMPRLPSPRPKPDEKLAAKALDAVEAEVIPEHITAKATMKVTKWMPKALWVYRAAPAALGYLVTSSR